MNTNRTYHCTEVWYEIADGNGDTQRVRVLDDTDHEQALDLLAEVFANTGDARIYVLDTASGITDIRHAK